MVKAILFDYGGVITAGGAGDELSKRLAVNLKITEEEAVSFIFSNWRNYLKGEITESQLWEQAEKHFNKTIPLSNRNVWGQWKDMQPQKDVIQLIDQLRGSYKIGLLSNTIPPTSEDILKHGGYKNFDFCILSCEVGYAKPDIEIYNLALEKLPGINPEEVIFIDDQERCLAPARELGLKTILAQNPTQIKKDLEALLS